MGNLTLENTALPARTETHDFLVREDALAFNGHYMQTSRKRHDLFFFFFLFVYLFIYTVT